MSATPVVVVDGGRNNLLAVCYLAKAGKCRRPTRRLSGHTVPGVSGLFTCGTATAPVGGIPGSSVEAAALELLKVQA